MDSEDYQIAQSEGDAAEMGRIIMQAKIQGMNEYNANEGKDEVLAQELALIEGVRSDTSVNDGYWDAGYTLGQEFSKGRLAGMRGNTGAGSGRYDARMDPSSSEYDPAYAFTGYATGLERVPYNNFPALLHEGERVLTAREARNYARGGGSGGIQITMNGTVIREEADIDRVAQRLLNKILAAKTAGVYGE